MNIVVGIPTLNEASTIERVTRVVDAGLRMIPGNHRIVNCDSDSTDGTRTLFLGTNTTTHKDSIVSDSPIQGKGTNVLAILASALEAPVDAVVIVDGDLASIEPNWIGTLAIPVIRDGTDYVSPAFQASQGGPLRHLISRPICAGMFRLNISQPTGGEIGLSPDFCSRVLSSLSTTDTPPVHGYGIDIYIAIQAALQAANISIVDLGKKTHRGRRWSTITPIAEQVAQTGLDLVRRNAALLKSGWSPGAVTAPRGMDIAAVDAPTSAGLIDFGALGQWRRSDRFILKTYHEILPTELIAQLARSEEVGQQLWRDCLASFACKAISGVDPALLAARLMPLFTARMHTFAREVLSSHHAVSEALKDDIHFWSDGRWLYQEGVE